MPKGDTKVQHVRPVKAKTPAQLAKRDRNVELARKRLAELQQKQRLANKLRKEHGFVGTDDQVIVQFNEMERAAAARQYVKDVLEVPGAGKVVARWLKDRVNQAPEHVASLIRKFLNRDGSVEGHKDNRNLKAQVENHLSQLKLAKAA